MRRVFAPGDRVVFNHTLSSLEGKTATVLDRADWEALRGRPSNFAHNRTRVYICMDDYGNNPYLTTNVCTINLLEPPRTLTWPYEPEDIPYYGYRDSC